MVDDKLFQVCTLYRVKLTSKFVPVIFHFITYLKNYLIILPLLLFCFLSANDAIYLAFVFYITP